MSERVKRVFLSYITSSASFLLVKVCDCTVISSLEQSLFFSSINIFIPVSYFLWKNTFLKSLQIVQASDLFLISQTHVSVTIPKVLSRAMILIYIFTSSLWDLLLSLFKGISYLEVFWNNIKESYILIQIFAPGLSPFIQMRLCTGSFIQSFLKLTSFTLGTLEWLAFPTLNSSKFLDFGILLIFCLPTSQFFPELFSPLI